MSADLSLVSSLLASSFSGLISRVLCHPIDTVKSRLQSPFTTTPSAPAVLRALFAEHGYAGLYLGLPVTIVGGVPGTVMYLTSYDKFKDLYNKRFGTSQDSSCFVRDFSAGIIAETFACVVYVPVDVVKERMQIQGKALPISLQYKSSLDALVTIGKNEGLRGIYKGYGATLLSFGPFSAFYFMFYEKFKEVTKERWYGGAGGVLPFGTTVGVSAAAGAAASFITSPLDLAKLRMQVSRAEGGARAATGGADSYATFMASLRTIYARDGVAGLFRGSIARVVFFCPATAVTMGCYETFKDVLKKERPAV
jgi:hypothetical protein